MVQRALPSVERTLRHQLVDSCFSSARGTNVHIIGHDVASWRNRDYRMLKRAIEVLPKPYLDSNTSAVGRGRSRQRTRSRLCCREVTRVGTTPCPAEHTTQPIPKIPQLSPRLQCYACGHRSSGVACGVVQGQKCLTRLARGSGSAVMMVDDPLHS
jgi:hypothetical protein